MSHANSLPVLLVLDLIGAFVFALSGATAGVRHRLDLFRGSGLVVFNTGVWLATC